MDAIRWSKTYGLALLHECARWLLANSRTHVYLEPQRCRSLYSKEQQSRMVRPRPQWEFGFPILRQCANVHCAVKEFRISCLAKVEAHDVHDGDSMGISPHNQV